MAILPSHQGCPATHSSASHTLSMDDAPRLPNAPPDRPVPRMLSRNLRIAAADVEVRIATLHVTASVREADRHQRRELICFGIGMHADDGRKLAWSVGPKHVSIEIMAGTHGNRDIRLMTDGVLPFGRLPSLAEHVRPRAPHNKSTSLGLLNCAVMWDVETAIWDLTGPTLSTCRQFPATPPHGEMTKGAPY